MSPEIDDIDAPQGGGRDLGPVPDDQILSFRVLLSSLPPDMREDMARKLARSSPHTRRFGDWMSRLLQAARADLDSVRFHLLCHGLQIVGTRLLPGEISAIGPAGAIRRAFGIDLRIVGDGEDRFHVPTGPATLPLQLLGSLVAVSGLDTRPFSDRRGVRLGMPKREASVRTVVDLAARYAFPKCADGTGQKIGVILLGGGFKPYGIETYFRCLGLKKPAISVAFVNNAPNDPAGITDIQNYLVNMKFGSFGPPAACAGQLAEPGTPGAVSPLSDVDDRGISGASQISWTIEGLMDVQLVGGAAPGASITVYITRDAVDGLANAIKQAVDDGMGVITCSLSNYERDKQYAEPIEVALEYAANKGVAVCCSSGNDGSTAKRWEDDLLAVAYPASSQWALACGGTRIPSWDAPDEIAWNDSDHDLATGGGYSAVYPVPLWQKGIIGSDAGRGVPDVASDASLDSGCWLWFGDDAQPIGVNSTSGGTSASAPVWAGLIARLRQALGRPLCLRGAELYAAGVRSTFQPITTGDNILATAKVDKYHARSGWNACTGLGRPNGEALLVALSKPGRRAARRSRLRRGRP